MLVGRIRSIVNDPVTSWYRARSRFGSSGLHRRYADLCRRRGLDRLFFVLSLDCDTEEDIRAAWGVHTRLVDMGIRPVYAVPGELLRKGEKVYRRISGAGGSFINHGGRSHTYFDGDSKRYRSCFFYDQLPQDVIHEDVIDGDACLKDVLGIAPKGFRTPHFGTFQKPKQLRFLHRILRELGYSFSSSTVPIYGFRYGPMFDRFGVFEFPIGGRAATPFLTLDTWSCFAAPNRQLMPEDYKREGSQIADLMSGLGVGLLNYYADPSHVCDGEIFFETIARWCEIAEPVTFDDLVERLA